MFITFNKFLKYFCLNRYIKMNQMKKESFIKYFNLYLLYILLIKLLSF